MNSKAVKWDKQVTEILKKPAYLSKDEGKDSPTKAIEKRDTVNMVKAVEYKKHLNDAQSLLVGLDDLPYVTFKQKEKQLQDSIDAVREWEQAYKDYLDGENAEQLVN